MLAVVIAYEVVRRYRVRLEQATVQPRSSHRPVEAEAAA